MPPITCHILDTTSGRPALGVTCALYKLSPDALFMSNTQELLIDELGDATPFAVAQTNSDGRIPKWVVNKKYGDLESVGVDRSYEWTQLKKGVYKIRFHTKHYFVEQKASSFFPFVDIHFVVEKETDHYHIPLLLSNYGYTTYRGS